MTDLRFEAQSFVGFVDHFEFVDRVMAVVFLLKMSYKKRHLVSNIGVGGERVARASIVQSADIQFNN
jgi:hypothetical protein